MKTYTNLRNSEFLYRLFDEGFNLRDFVYVRKYVETLTKRRYTLDGLIDYLKRRAKVFDERLAITFNDILNDAVDVFKK